MKARIIDSVQAFLLLFIPYFIAIILLRIYELSFVVSDFGLSGLQNEVLGILWDVYYSFKFFLPLYLLYLLLGFISKKTAHFTSVLVLLALLMAQIGILRYYLTTSIPLSADLFGYSFEDISTTILSSGGLEWASIIGFIIIIGAFLVSHRMISKQEVVVSGSYLLSIGALSVICILTPLSPLSLGEMKDSDYLQQENKSVYFGRKTLAFIASSSVETLQFAEDEYPLLKPFKPESGLAQYFNISDEPPSIVIIIVEGLGQDFVGRQSPLGGFTPFLDSLKNQSLYWENMLSTTGRTFGALPSILGSLPYGEAGFMGYGEKMPAHHSLISLLKPHGYTSNYFYGGNINFDKQDLFLEYQGIDFILSEENFPKEYPKMKGNDKGFSWGYADKIVFQYASQLVAQQKASPRLDIYLTLSTHEPFQVPEDGYETQWASIMKDPSFKDENYTSSKNIFQCLLYTDEAIKELVDNYKKLEDYNNTVFIITGDHRMIPLAPDSRLERFHVPLLIFSPLLKKTEVFKGLSTHSGLLPSLLGLLQQYEIDFPAEMAMLSSGLSLDTVFSSTLQTGLMRNKNEMVDYIEGYKYLSDNQLFTITDGLQLKPLSKDRAAKESLQKSLANFKYVNEYVCESNRLIKAHSGQNNLSIFSFSEEEMAWLNQVKAEEQTPDQRFKNAQQLAFNKEYVHSRALLRFLLNKSPNYHDARILLARTYAWNSDYDTATLYLKQVLKRSVNYQDAYVALVDIAYWKGDTKQHEDLITEGLRHGSEYPDLLAQKARLLFLRDDLKGAQQLIKKVLKIQPKNEIALDLSKKLQPLIP